MSVPDRVRTPGEGRWASYVSFSTQAQGFWVLSPAVPFPLDSTLALAGFSRPEAQHLCRIHALTTLTSQSAPLSHQTSPLCSGLVSHRPSRGWGQPLTCSHSTDSSGLMASRSLESHL